MLLYNHKNKKKIRKLDNANVDVSLRSSHTLLVQGQAFASRSAEASGRT